MQVESEGLHQALPGLAGGGSADAFLWRARAALAADRDWGALLAQRIEALADEEYVERARECHVDGVSPHPIVVHRWSGGARAVLNYFDRDDYLEHFRAGRITPHSHRFGFATRVLRGAYGHWLFHNAGTRERPELSLTSTATCAAGEVYTLHEGDFHFVVDPRPDTVTLMVQTPASRPAPRGGTRATGDVLRERARILEVLQG